MANPIYIGDFLWKGTLHRGKHEPLISRDLFDRAHHAMGLRSRTKTSKHTALGTAKTNYLASGVKLLELAQGAYDLYVLQPPHEQRRLLNVVVSNCRLNGGTIEYDFRKPFDLLAKATESNDWRRARDSNPWYPCGHT